MLHLDVAAAAAADELFWAKHPKLKRRKLTRWAADAAYRDEWMTYYKQNLTPPKLPPPTAKLPKPFAQDLTPLSFQTADSTPQTLMASGSLCQSNIAAMSHEQKMIEAINRAPLTDGIRKALPSPEKLIAGMILIGGTLAAVAATGLGAVAEAIGAGLLIVGAFTGGYKIGSGLVKLYEFFERTRCDRAVTEDDLNEAGNRFADGVGEMGVGGLYVGLSLLGAKELDPAPEGTTVIGKWPTYLNTAKDLEANVFSVPKELWESLTADEQWAMNQEFLDEIIARGDKVVLSNPPTDANLGSFFARELEYMQSHGYTIDPSGKFLIPPK